MRLGFCGSPPLAAVVLEALVEDGHDVALVVTRRDARRGRNAEATPTAVKAAALARGLTVTEDVTDLARGDLGLELAVVVAYGAMVPTEVLDALVVLNLHFSLLPRWRGAAPVERAILAGDTETGVCVMRLEATLDTGPTYACATVPVGDQDLETLRATLVAQGARLLRPLLSGGVGDLPEPVPQSGDATYARKVTDRELELDFERPATELARVVRLGRAWTTLAGRRLRVRRVEVLHGDHGAPGALDGDVVACGTGALRLGAVVPEGRGERSFAEHLRGLRGDPPTHLGAPAHP